MEERSHSLAIMYLTRRDDLVIMTPTGPDKGWDLLIALKDKGVTTGRIFATQIKSLRTAQSQTHALDPDRVQLSLHKLHFSPAEKYVHADLAIPLCLFLFTMTDDEGYYSWLREPVCNGRSSLRTKAPHILERLTSESLDAIVQAVRNWYLRQREFDVSEKEG